MLFGVVVVAALVAVQLRGGPTVFADAARQAMSDTTIPPTPARDGREKPVPLEWVGITVPWTPERLAEVDRRLGIDSTPRPEPVAVAVRGGDDGAALRSVGVTVRFGGNLALADVSLEAESGQVVGLIGPNGAGKTTLFNVITGLQACTEGRVRARRRRPDPAEPDQAGPSRPGPHLPAPRAVHHAVGAREHRGGRRRPPSLVADQASTSTSRSTTSSSGSGLARWPTRGSLPLPTGQGRLVELGRALACEPKVLLLDEPAAGQDDTETERFSVLLRELAGEGVAVVLVEHDMKLVMDVCDVDPRAQLRPDPGRRARPEEIRAHDAVREAYLGRRRAGARHRERHDRAEAPDVRARCSSCAASSRLRRHRRAPRRRPRRAAGHGRGGARPERCGQDHHACGWRPACIEPTAGDVLVAGRRVNGASPDDLARCGLCLIPEGRGIFPNLTVRENLWMMTYAGTSVLGDRRGRLRPVPPPAASAAARRPARSRAASSRCWPWPAAWSTDPALLILDELSMGLAPLVVEELFGLVAQVAAEGVAILVVEQFASVVLDVADHVALMVNGRIVRVRCARRGGRQPVGGLPRRMTAPA